MKKLYAGAGKLAGVVSIKTTDMKDFLKTISKHIEVKRESFKNQSGELIEYDNYEVVKSLAYYENYKHELDILATKASKAANKNTVMPEVKSAEKPPIVNAANSVAIEVNPNEDEIPF